MPAAPVIAPPSDLDPRSARRSRRMHGLRRLIGAAVIGVMAAGCAGGRRAARVSI